MAGVLIKRMPYEETDVHKGRVPREHEGRDGVKHLQAKEHQRLPASHQKLGESHGTDFFLTAFRRN